MTSTDSAVFQLPKLRVSFGFQNDVASLKNDDDVAEFFDVKFCPYQPLSCDPVFAAISKKHVIICRLRQDSGDHNPCEVLRVIRDNDDDACSCCCTWVKDPVTGAPFLCTGGVDAKVKIYNIIDGSLAECFVGHGGDVNDLATSPADSSLIASASDDTTVRIWSIDPKHKDQPCLCILAGEGHSWGLLSVAFHDNGRYLLSAGHDQTINLWTLPELPEEPIKEPLLVCYPHFSTSAVHGGIIDCVSFFGDYILSRACHDNFIALWRIEGFSSLDTPPPLSAAPTPVTVVPTNFDDHNRLTRSAFVPNPGIEWPAQYTRLAVFHTPNCGPQFFMRFGLHHVPDQNPVLAFCNAGGMIFFWDFTRLSMHQEVMERLEDEDRDKDALFPLPNWLRPIIPRQRADASGNIKKPVASKDGGVPSQSKGDFTKDTLEAWAARYSIKDSHQPIKAHKSENSADNFVGRKAAWSPGGEWCVVVGSNNTALIMQRWSKKPL